MLAKSPYPRFAQSIENKGQEQVIPGKIFHPKDLSVKILNPLDLEKVEEPLSVFVLVRGIEMEVAVIAAA